MLPCLHTSLERGELPIIMKTVDREDVSLRGAFPLGTCINLTIRCKRRLGIRAVVLRFQRDGGECRDIPFSFADTCCDEDKYRLSLSLTEELCGGQDGLFYYEVLFLRGFDTLFTHTENNVDFTLGNEAGRRFRLLVYRKDYSVPSWFSGGVMYHVFVDRFFCGNGKVGSREDAELNEDWYGGIQQYAPYPGAPVKNNEFFGGNLWGVAEKLDYLASLGVTTVYLSPIFKAYSNHKYDTGDYMQVDEMFGGEAALDHLIAEADKRGMRLILDGVFNHTGDDSRYFNRYGKYDSVGAYQSWDSPYHDWFCFEQFPDSYSSWWGIEILPKLNPSCRACREFLAGKDGVAETYIKKGIGGWRLDVADELSDEFLDLLRKTVKGASDNEGIIIGEVWENAADKSAYGKRRRYFRGEQLDSVMNYPSRNAILSFVRDRDAQAFYNGVTEIYASYPKSVCDSLMNLLGTHDTERILSILGGNAIEGLDNRSLSAFRMSEEARKQGVALLKIASVLQYTLYGVPSLYYGDEAGVEGGHDPFCRLPYPWGREEKELLSHYQKLGEIRRTYGVFRDGTFRFVKVDCGFVAYERCSEDQRILVAANRSPSAVSLTLDGQGIELLQAREVEGEVLIAPDTACIFAMKTRRKKGAGYAGETV